MYPRNSLCKLLNCPMQNKTKMWNLVFSNHTVELINNVTILNPSYTRDGKPSVVLDYGQSEAIIFRQFRDEMREVSGNPQSSSRVFNCLTVRLGLCSMFARGICFKCGVGGFCWLVNSWSAQEQVTCRWRRCTGK